MTLFDRRHFLKTSALAAGAFYMGSSRSFAASDDIRMAVIGVRGKGKSAIQDVFRTDGARLVAICDADTAYLDERAAEIKTEKNLDVEKYQDYRDVLDHNGVDAVIITTPNHWHSLMTIQAIQAGKDVYCEKPVCHSIWEGRKMVEAAANSDRIVQSGFQNRSDDGLRQAFPYILEGHVGPITMVRGLCYRNRTGIGKIDTPLTPPSTIDYNLWLGPAQDQPIYRPHLHYDWHWDFNTGNGDIGNQGPHELDLIRWILGDPDHPKGVTSFGGRFAWHDAGNTPNMQGTLFDFGNIPVLFEVRDLWINRNTEAAASFKGRRVGVIVTCEGGEFRGGRGGGILYDNAGTKIMDWKGDAGFDHFPNFIRAVKDRNDSQLRSPIESGYKSSCLAHMANISYRTGNTLSEKNMDRRISKSAVMTEIYERFNAHLADWDIDLNEERWTLGNKLKFNPKRERFTGGTQYKEANGLIKSNYRKEFTVPNIV